MKASDDELGGRRDDKVLGEGGMRMGVETRETESLHTEQNNNGGRRYEGEL